jgi:hypothetical protein
MTQQNDVLAPDVRLREVARILALGILRLHSRAALVAAADEPGVSENPAQNAQDCLEVSPATVLTVHTG